MGQYNLKRYRKVLKTITWAAGGGDQIPLVGPFNELIWHILGTTDAHTVDAFPAGVGRFAAQIQFVSNKRGNIGMVDSMSLLGLAYGMFNTWHWQDTVAGVADDGCGGILPLGADFDEIITMNVTFGTLEDMCSADDLVGYTGVLRCTLGVLNTPMAGTYWAYYTQQLGVAGVVGIGAGAQQPPASVFPGFLSVGECFMVEHTSRVTAFDFRGLAEVRVSSADDLLVDDYTLPLALIQKRHVMGGHGGTTAGIDGHTCVGLTRHVPVVTNDSYLVHVVGGAAATILPSRMVYIYQGGIVSHEGDNPTKPDVGVNTPSQPTIQGHLQPNVGSSGVGTMQTGYRDVGSASSSMTKSLFQRRGA
jgi:hypothetical protein